MRTVERREVSVLGREGLHARPINLFLRLASKYQCDVRLIKGNEVVDGRSILQLLSLAAVQGTKMTLETDGEDAKAAIDELGKFFLIDIDQWIEEHPGATSLP